MIISCLDSGSNGNCFLITNSCGEVIVLDAGVKFNKITEHKRFTRCGNIAGAFITHHHKDHSLSEQEILKAGISVFSYANLEPKKKYRVGNYEFMPFICPHDGVKNYGYIIKSTVDNLTLVYATDTTALPIVKNVDVWLVECNYTQKKWEENVAKTDNYRYFGRVVQSHMSLEYLYNFFLNGVKSTSKAIILCHLSENGNADKDAMKQAISPFATLVDTAFKDKEWVI